MYKLNMYHYYIEHKPSNILYNTLTGHLMWTNDAFSKAYSDLLHYSVVDDLILFALFKDKKLIEKLKNEGFIIPTQMDEVMVIKKLLETNQFSDNSSNIEFITTYNCNLNCNYCYAIRNRTTMSAEIALKSSKFAIDFAKKRKSDRMVIQFIGGEPLLNQNAIETIVEKIYSYKKSANIEMTTQLTSNGILLNDSIIGKIRQLGPIKIQVTLDGPENIHNSRRGLRNGNSFKLIFNNIIKLKNEIDDLVIRINVDKENVKFCDQLLLELERNDLTSASLSIVPTFSHTEQCSHYESFCLSREEMIEALNLLWQKAINLGFKPGFNPLPRFLACGSISAGSIAIDPFGDIYKCAATYGDKNFCIGNIFQGINEQKYSINNRLENRNPLDFTDTKCLKCASLPLCSGGCAFRAYQKTGTFHAPDCRFDMQDCIKDQIRNYADWYKKNGFQYSLKMKI